MEHDAGAADLRDGELRPVELGGCKVLLARVAGQVRAVGGVCPHAGGPLHEGVLTDDGTVLCPWHKAAFRLDTGAHVSPPAVDDIPSYPVREHAGRLLVELDATRRPAAPQAAGAGTLFVVVGAGAAGAVAAQTLREQGFAGQLVMVGREDRLPYDRTVLSKYALSGQKGGEKSPLHGAAFYEANRIERVVAEVVALDPAARDIRFANGDGLHYDQALLATGSTPRPLGVPGHDLAGVHLLRSADDADAILRSAEHARCAVVVGGGFIAVEAAGSLRERGLEVHVVMPGAEPFEKVLGPEVGRAFRRFHEGKGVTFHPGSEVAAVEGERRVERVRLKSGSTVSADLVVAGLGVRPATDMLRGVQLRDDGGVPVGPDLLAAPGLYAAGDLAAFPDRGDGVPIRVEHWRVAEQHGRVAALNMLGRAGRFDAVPYFWTIHYKKRLDYVVHAAEWDRVEIDGDLREPNFAAYYVKDGLVKAVAGWGRDTAMAMAIGLMDGRRDWTAEALQEALAGEVEGRQTALTRRSMSIPAAPGAWRRRRRSSCRRCREVGRAADRSERRAGGTPIARPLRHVPRPRHRRSRRRRPAACRSPRQCGAARPSPAPTRGRFHRAGRRTGPPPPRTRPGAGIRCLTGRSPRARPTPAQEGGDAGRGWPRRPAPCVPCCTTPPAARLPRAMPGYAPSGRVRAATGATRAPARPGRSARRGA